MKYQERATKASEHEQELIRFNLIDTDDKIIEFRRDLYYRNITTIAVDFEAEYNLHEYGEKLCLIQIFDGNSFYLIDPFLIIKDEIKKTLENNKIIKLFYGADSDKSLVLKQYGIRIKSIYDQKLLVDVLKFEEKRLDKVIERVLGIALSTNKKYQFYNWTKRPIDESAIQYALTDVKYLFKLNAELIKLVTSENKINDLAIRLIRYNDKEEKNGSPRIYRLHEYKALSDVEKKRFSIILNIREDIAREYNIPPALLLKKEHIINSSKNLFFVSTLKATKKVTNEMLKRMIDRINTECVVALLIRNLI